VAVREAGGRSCRGEEGPAHCRAEVCLLKPGPAVLQGTRQGRRGEKLGTSRAALEKGGGPPRGIASVRKAGWPSLRLQEGSGSGHIQRPLEGGRGRTCSAACCHWVDTPAAAGLAMRVCGWAFYCLSKGSVPWFWSRVLSSPAWPCRGRAGRAGYDVGRGGTKAEPLPVELGLASPSTSQIRPEARHVNHPGWSG
jgi:hypothetical protein